jgi:hypothetical protein
MEHDEGDEKGGNTEIWARKTETEVGICSLRNDSMLRGSRDRAREIGGEDAGLVGAESPLPSPQNARPSGTWVGR